MDPNLTVVKPANNQVVQLNQAFQVTGQASDKGFPEPRMIDSVTVQVDGGPIINATLKHVPHTKKPTFSFNTMATVTGGQDPHTVLIIATDDQGLSVSDSVSVFTGPIFQIDAPSIELDVIYPFPIAKVEPDDPMILSWISQMQYQLVPINDNLAQHGKKLIGPNVVSAVNSVGLNVMRFGIWIENSDFPAAPPALPDFPLPRLLEQAAIDGFNSAPLLDVPGPKFGPSFALNIPVTTFQKLIDAGAQDVKDAASQQGISLDTISVNVSDPNSVTLHLTGSGPLDIPFDIDATEFIGLKFLTSANPPQHVPVITGTDVSSSVGGVPDWFMVVFPNLLSVLAIYAGIKASEQVNGIIAPLIAQIPTRFPFSNNISTQFSGLPDFPTLVPDWQTFGVANSGILGRGISTIEARDQSMVSLAVDGLGNITGPQEELNGGTGEGYYYRLTNLAPDSDKFKWQVSGTASTNGSIDRLPFDQSGEVDIDYKLPLHVKPGTYPFTVTVNATETCGSDPNKQLSASVTKDIQIIVKKNPKIPK